MDYDELKLSLLEAGGVDNWSGYEISIEMYEEETGESCEGINVLYALEQGGVDNWEWYSESLENFNEYVDYLNDNPESKLSFSDYIDYIDEQKKLDRKEQEKHVLEMKKQKEYDEKEKFYNMTADDLIAPGLYLYIEFLYPDKSNKFHKDLYQKAIDEGLLKFSLFPKEFQFAKNEAIKRGAKTIKDFQSISIPVLVEELIKNDKLKDYLINLKIQ